MNTISLDQPEIADLLPKHGGKTGAELHCDKCSGPTFVIAISKYGRSIPIGRGFDCDGGAIP